MAIPRTDGSEPPTLLVSMRNVGGMGLPGQPAREANTRALRTSEDGGVTWSDHVSGPTAQTSSITIQYAYSHCMLA